MDSVSRNLECLLLCAGHRVISLLQSHTSKENEVSQMSDVPWPVAVPEVMNIFFFSSLNNLTPIEPKDSFIPLSLLPKLLRGLVKPHTHITLQLFWGFFLLLVMAKGSSHSAPVKEKVNFKWQDVGGEKHLLQTPSELQQPFNWTK